MALGHEHRLLTRPSTTARATGAAAAGATDHNRLTARRSTAARSANNKLDCGGSLTDPALANSAAMTFGPACWLAPRFRVLELPAAADYASTFRCRPRPLVTTYGSRVDRHEQ